MSGQQCVSVAAGEYHSIAITAVGTAYTWGHGGYGQLGHGDSDNCYSPEQIESLVNVHVVSAAAGGVHSLLCIEGEQTLTRDWSVQELDNVNNNNNMMSTGT